MKNIYVLTAFDCSSQIFTATQHYSNKKAAIESFDELRIHLITKHKINPSNCEIYTYKDGGETRTDVLDKRYNVSLVKFSVSKEKSKFIY